MTTEPSLAPSTVPELDISIVTYNSERWLEGFFESLASQSYPLSKMRIWVRDNGSSDGTVACLRQWAVSWEDRCPVFRIEEGKNVGFGRGHNANLNNAQTPYFLVTNVDLTFESEALTTAVQTAEADRPDTASWELRQKPYEHPKVYHPATLETLWSSHACILFRRTALQAVGGYEEGLFLYGEDVELSYRLRDHGYRLRYVPSAVCWHFSYERAGETKREQFLGSKLANLLIRMRYGSWLEILAVPALYVALWGVPPRFPQYYRGLLAIGTNLVRDAPRFLLSRRQSKAPFPFRGWDYEQTRPSPFYPLPRALANPPLVSVVTRTMRGRSLRLREALKSLANQTYRNVEAIVVEDGSDEARELVESYRGQGALTGLKYLSIEKSGRCRAGNMGLTAARGDYLCFLDDDDLFFADHLEVLVAVLESNASLGGAYGLAFEVPSRSLSETDWGSHAPRYRVLLRQKYSRALLWDHNFLPIQSVLFRRNLYDTCGGFDEELENLEDWNLWVRFSLRAPFQMVDRVTSLYMVPMDGKSALERQDELEIYRSRAVEKNAMAQVTLTVGEVLEAVHEVDGYRNILALRRSMLRSIALALPFASRAYYWMRSIGQALSRRD